MHLNGFAPWKNGISELSANIQMYITIHEKLFPGDVLTEAEVMMLINAADKDGDGSLDFQEFVKIMMWTFQKPCFEKNRMTNQLREL